MHALEANLLSVSQTPSPFDWRFSRYSATLYNVATEMKAEASESSVGQSQLWEIVSPCATLSLRCLLDFGRLSTFAGEAVFHRVSLGAVI
jgi:hypothetical protein